jgi:hypothetical protein
MPITNAQAERNMHPRFITTQPAAPIRGRQLTTPVQRGIRGACLAAGITRAMLEVRQQLARNVLISTGQGADETGGFLAGTRQRKRAATTNLRVTAHFLRTRRTS